MMLKEISGHITRIIPIFINQNGSRILQEIGKKKLTNLSISFFLNFIFTLSAETKLRTKWK